MWSRVNTSPTNNGRSKNMSEEAAENLGEVAYKAYSDAVGGKSIHGEHLPPYNHLSAAIQDAWQDVADAIIEAVEQS